MSFSVLRDAAWAPELETRDAWLDWAYNSRTIAGQRTPPTAPMPPLLRRRAGFLGRMALEVAYQCLGTQLDIPVVLASRHGDTPRVVDLLFELAREAPLSPTSFGLSVHNAIGGLFSIARADHANMIAIAGGKSTVEYAALEACSLLEEGAPLVLMVAYDCALPPIYKTFVDDGDQPYAWAWLMKSPGGADCLNLHCSSSETNSPETAGSPGLDVWRFYLRDDRHLERTSNGRRWLWTRGA